MAKDHYVAQTYLKSFSVEHRESFVNAIKKSDLKQLNAIPTKSICYKIDWSTNSYFPNNPRVIEDYLKIFEPRWMTCIKSLSDEKFNMEIKYLMSGYIAYLKTYTPTAARLAEKSLSEVVRQTYEILEKKELLNPDSKYASVIKKIQKGGGVRINVKTDYAKALGAQSLYALLQGYLRFPWKVLMNDTKIPFISSDNPVCWQYWNDHSYPDLYFPITPKMALLIHPLPIGAATIPDAPMSIKPEGVELFNTLTVKCAENIVIFNKDFGVGALVKEFQNWKTEMLVTKIPQEKGALIWTQERPTNGMKEKN